MKRVVLCSVIITFIMIISLTGTFIVRHSCREMKEECKKVTESYKNGEKVSDDMKEIFSLWDEKTELLCFIVNKDKLDETGFVISELLDADDMHEGDFLSGMDSLIYSIEDIAEDETPNFKNIF